MSQDYVWIVETLFKGKWFTSHEAWMTRSDAREWARFARETGAVVRVVKYMRAGK